MRLLALRAIQYLLLFAFNVGASRALGPSGRADYVLPATVGIVVGIATHLSVEGAVGRLLAHQELPSRAAARLTVALVLLVGLLGAIVFAAVVPIVAPLLPSSISTTSWVLAGATIPFTSGSYIAATLLLRLGGVTSYGVISLLTAAAQAGMLVVAWSTGHVTPEIALLCVLAGWSLNLIAVFGVLCSRLGAAALLPAAPLALVKRAVALGVRLHPSAIAVFLILRLDLLLVGVMRSRADAGRYSVATSIAEVVFLAAWSIALAGLQRQTEGTDAEAVSHTVAVTRNAVLISTAMAAAIAAVAYPLIHFVYGARFTGAVLPLILLGVGAIGLAVEAPLRGLLVRLVPLTRISTASCGALALSVVLELLLIPTAGIVGAAVASLISYWFAAFLMMRLVRSATGVGTRAFMRLPSR
jgi:O-antigen/teichoic acid export membrane protein